MWETIAASFDASRTRTWDHVEAYLQGASGRILDLMAGNGRHTVLGERLGLEMVWSDWSRPMAAAMRGRIRGPIVVSDATNLPFRDAVFDGCAYTAGWHGLPTPEGRHASLRELRRVLKPHAEAQITVWSRQAPRFRDRGDPGPMDVELPWRSGGHAEMRTYHLATPESFEADLEAAGLRVLHLEEVAIVSRSPDNLVALVAPDL